MAFIQDIKNSFGNYFLNQQARSNHRQKAFVNIEEAKTIGIVFDATDADDFDLVKKYVSYLKDMKKKVKAIGYFNQPLMPPMTFSKLEYDFFCSKELNWYNAPSSIYVKNFMEDEFDILLDLNISDCFPLRYVSTLSKARFKVGKTTSKNNSIFDLMLETGDTNTLKFYLRNIDTYLFMINKSNNSISNSDEQIQKV